MRYRVCLRPTVGGRIETASETQLVIKTNTECLMLYGMVRAAPSLRDTRDTGPAGDVGLRCLPFVAGARSDPTPG